MSRKKTGFQKHNICLLFIQSQKIKLCRVVVARGYGRSGYSYKKAAEEICR